MVTKEMRMAATEINQILRYTEEVEVNKIPLGLRLFLKDIEDPTYKPNIHPEVSLFEHRLLYETELILGMIYCYYWSDEEELRTIPEKVKMNAQLESKKVFGSFRDGDYFETEKEREKNSLEETAMIVRPEYTPWYKKLFGMLKKNR